MDHSRRDDELLEQQRDQRRKERLKQKKRQQMQTRIIIAILALILVLIVVLVVRGCQAENPQVPADTPVQTPAAPGAEGDLPDQLGEPDTVITLAAVGNILVYEDQLELALRPDGSYDFAPSFSAVSALTMSADLMVGNLEVNLCPQPYAGDPTSRVPVTLADALRNTGFDLVQTANTASIRNGISGLDSTIDALSAVGIAHVGTYADAAAKAANEGVLLMNVGGIRIAFLSFTKGVDNLSLPEGSEYAVDLLYEDYFTEYNEINKKAIRASLEAAEALNPDLTVAMLHWGSEWDKGVIKSQQEIADMMLEGGVDVILGSHPHVVGKMEMRTLEEDDGSLRNCFIAYSLGNFLCSPDHPTQARATESLILNIQVTKDGQTGATTITDVAYTPLYIAETIQDGSPSIQVLPIREAIKSGLFPELEADMTDAIAHLRSDTESDLDSGR